MDQLWSEQWTRERERDEEIKRARQEAGKLGKGHTFQKKSMELYCVDKIKKVT